jgi:uncharacterized membrane protein HdeD (DUF308 family)
MMTDPRTGPASQTGGSGQQAGGPPAGQGQGSTGQEHVNPAQSVPGGMDGGHGGPGSSGTAGAGASATGVTTAQRTSAGAPNVPQQYGRQSEYGAETDESEQSMRMGPGGGMLAAAAGRAWPALLLGGLGLIAVGIALLVWPHASLTVIAILIGAAVLGSGIVRMYEGFTASNQSGGMRAGYIVIGLLAVLAGLYLLRHHSLSLFLVAFVTGVFFIAQGISELGVAISAHVPGRGVRAVLGVFSLAAGILMVVWPSITLVLLFTLVAAWLLFYGVLLAALSFGLRKTSKQAKADSAGGTPSSRTLAASTR